MSNKLIINPNPSTALCNSWKYVFEAKQIWAQMPKPFIEWWHPSTLAKVGFMQQFQPSSENPFLHSSPQCHSQESSLFLTLLFLLFQLFCFLAQWERRGAGGGQHFKLKATKNKARKEWVCEDRETYFLLPRQKGLFLCQPVFGGVRRSCLLLLIKVKRNKLDWGGRNKMLLIDSGRFLYCP